MNDIQIGHLYSGLYMLDKRAEQDGLSSWKEYVIQTHDDVYIIRGRKGDIYSVNLKNRTCTCLAAKSCWHIAAIEVYCTNKYPPQTEESIRITNSDIDYYAGRSLHRLYVVSGRNRIPVGNQPLALAEWKDIIKNFGGKELVFAPRTTETDKLLSRRN